MEARTEGLVVSVIDSPAALAALAAEWTALHGRSAQGWPHTTHAWLMACWRSVATARDVRLHVVSVRAADRLVLVLPLVARRNLLGLLTLTTLDSGMAVYPELLLEDGDAGVAALAACARHLQADRRLWRLRFNFVRQGGDLARLMTLLGASRSWSAPASRVSLRRWADFDSFLASRSQNFRRDYVRTRRHLQAAGLAELKRATNDAEIAQVMQWLLAAKLDKLADDRTAQWLGTARTQNFLTEVAQAGRGDDSVRLHYLAEGGQVIAAELVLRARDTLMLSKCAYNPRFGHLSVGTYAKFEILREAMADGISEIDLMLGQYRWKERLRTGVAEVASWRVYGHFLSRLFNRHG